jgi:hypothetical protein
MAEVVICDTLGFSQAEYNVGYIPANTDVVLSGLIRFDVSPDFPFTNRIVSFDSECTQIKFPGQSGYTNNYNLIINPDNQYYIPFRINLGMIVVISIVLLLIFSSTKHRRVYLVARVVQLFLPTMLPATNKNAC